MSKRPVVLVIAAAGALALVLWLGTRAGERRARSDEGTRPPASAPSADSERGPIALVEPARALPAEPASPAEPSRVQVEEAELADARWVEGRVIFPPDTPPDESVRVVARGRSFASGREHRCVVGRDGAFRVAFAEKTRKGTIALEARYLYLEEGSIRINLSEPIAPLVLDPLVGGRIEGRIVVPADSGVSEESLAGATVQLVDLDPTRIRKTMGSGPNAALQGHAFALGGLRPSAGYHLELESEVVYAPRITGLEIRLGERTEVELVVRQGVSVTGRVVDEQAAPLGAISVSAFSRDRASFQPTSFRAPLPIRTGEDGAFHLRGLAPGRITLKAEGEGLEHAERVLEASEPGMVLSGIDLVLARGLSLTGRVQWPDGRPAKASVEIHGEGPAGWSDQYQTGEEGAWAARGLVAGNYRVEARATESVETGAGAKKSKERRIWCGRAEGVSAGTSDLVLTLEPSRSLFGMVRDDQGTLVDAFEIQARRDDSQGFRSGVSASARPPSLVESFRDARGAFKLAGFLPGSWIVEAHAEGYGSSQPMIVLFSAENAAVELVLPRLGRIQGTVVDPGGRPVARAEVSLAPVGFGFLPWNARAGDSARTDGNGRFLFEDVDPGSVSLRAVAPVAAPSELMSFTLEPGGLLAKVELRLGRGGRIDGQVVDADGRPLAQREVSLWDAGSGTPRATRTDGEGSFAFENLPAGRFHLSCAPTLEEIRALLGDDLPEHGHEDLLARKAEVELADGESKEVRLAPPTLAPVRLHGRVLAGGTPLAGARVEALPSDGGDGVSTRTDEDGSYSVVLPRPGEHSVSVHDQATGLWLQRDLDVPPLESFVLDFAIASGSVSGRVRAADGTLLDGIEVMAHGSQGAGKTRSGNQATTGTDGSYALALPAGTYVILAGGPDGWGRSPSSWCSARTEVEVTAERETRGIDLELQRGGTIEGSVRNANGSALGFGSHVVAVGAGNKGIATVSLLPTGDFRIQGIPPGTVWVEARSDGRTTSVRLELEVDTDRPVRVDLQLVAARDDAGEGD